MNIPPRFFSFRILSSVIAYRFLAFFPIVRRISLAVAFSADASTLGAFNFVRRLGKDRLPIYPLLSPAVPNLYGVIYENAEMDYYAILQKHIRRQVDRVLERRAA